MLHGLYSSPAAGLSPGHEPDLPADREGGEARRVQVGRTVLISGTLAWTGLCRTEKPEDLAMLAAQQFYVEQGPELGQVGHHCSIEE